MNRLYTILICFLLISCSVGKRNQFVWAKDGTTAAELSNDELVCDKFVEKMMNSAYKRPSPRAEVISYDRTKPMHEDNRYTRSKVREYCMQDKGYTKNKPTK
ncbi:MAG: hypothetical protein ACI9JR_002857 [Gammaproteobacteria bacterium]|jgi:hypothetical protein